ncbi:MAG: glycosyltransferase family 9 protein, partial [Robiginitomaculum sp.]|nr:glycosyltransferase family 9 protein [Robiginitomaculum sp.]
NKVFKQLRSTHDRYADVFKKLGFTIDISNPKPITRVHLFKDVSNITGQKNKPWVGVAPFAAFPSKTYPLDLMEEVIAGLSKDFTVFLFGGKEDETILETIISRHKNTISVAGKLGGFKNELNLISNLNIMLSMDSGNAHFSAMQQVPTITLWGGTHPFAGFAPFNQPTDYCLLPDLKEHPNIPCSIYGNKTCQGAEDVMRTILPKNILKKVKAVLEKN